MLVVVMSAVVPVLVAAHGPAPEDQGFARLALPTASSASDTVGWSGDPIRTALRYRQLRTEAIDYLLPEGVGGTHFFAHLDTNAGAAFPRSATIGLVAQHDIGAGEATELHERAHLLWGALPEVVDRIVRRVAAPEPTEYAAKNAGEHFSEMAGEAWTIVMPPRELCLVGSPVDWLEDAELRVPGTAGFVVWYLRHPSIRDVPARDSLLAAAAQMTQPLRDEWETLYAALEQRRRVDGTFEPWPREPLAAFMQRAYRDETDRRWYTAIRYLFLPSVLAARIYDFAGG